jgi:hypothetical protein
MELFNNFDATCFSTESKTYWFFKGNTCWSKERTYPTSQPRLISDVFPGVPNDLDAVVCTDEYYWFFKSGTSWSKKLGSHPVVNEGRTKIEWSDSKDILNNVDASCFSTDSGKYWFFKGKKCWSKKKGKGISNYSNISDKFPGVPNDLDGVLCTSNDSDDNIGLYWFFKGSKCWSKQTGNHNVCDRGTILENFEYYPSDFNTKSWMHDSLNIIGDKPLSKISIPGSHDSGMSISEVGTVGACDGNTKTQSNNILQQLEAGARYFDIRPIIGGGEFHTGHYTEVKEKDLKNKLPDWAASSISEIIGWQGARGESLSSIISEVNTFTKYHNELIILSLSHAYNTDHYYHDFNIKEWRSLLNTIKSNMDCLFVTKDDLLTKKMSDYIKNESAVLIIIPTHNFKKDFKKDFEKEFENTDGIYLGDKFKISGEYSSKHELEEMRKDQFYKMRNYSNNPSKFFKLSWTLTQSDEQAALCNTRFFGRLIQKYGSWLIGDDKIVRIEDLSTKANDSLYTIIPKITKDNFPNVISIDYFTNKATAVAIYSNTLRLK